MATAEVVVDTGVLVDHLRGARRLPAGRRLGVSVVSRCQLFAGADDLDALREFLLPLIELPVDAEIAELAGILRRGSGVATPDALIAATALRDGLPLMTRNVRHFAGIERLRLERPD